MLDKENVIGFLKSLRKSERNKLLILDLKSREKITSSAKINMLEFIIDSFNQMETFEFEKEKQEHGRRTILQYDLEGNFLKEYSSIKEASESTEVRANNIPRCLNGEYGSSGGYIWKYKYDIRK